jgi:hypothetical protein
VLAVTLLTGLASCSGQSITSGFAEEPEVYREDVGFDILFCMRVSASSAEVERFVNRVFSPSDRVAVHPDDSPLTCPAEFWPRPFSSATTAYRSERVAGGVAETQGVIVEDGYMYYWHISL